MSDGSHECAAFRRRTGSQLAAIQETVRALAAAIEAKDLAEVQQYLTDLRAHATPRAYPDT